MTKEDKLKCLAIAEEMTFEQITLGPKEDIEHYLHLFNAEYAIMDMRNAVMRGSADEDPDEDPDEEAEETEPAPTVAEPVEEPTYTFDEVKAFLSKRSAAISVKDLLAEFGVAKLSALPEEKYAELMERAGA